MKEIFEYRPACRTDKPMTFEELLMFSGLERHNLRFVMQDHGIRAAYKEGRTAFYSVEDCNKVLTEPLFFRNWHIEGWYSLQQGAVLFDLPPHYIQNAIYKGSIAARHHDFGRKGRTWVCWSDLEKLRVAFQSKGKQGKSGNAAQGGTPCMSDGKPDGLAAEAQLSAERLAELSAAHPLVKDARCFRLSWWPEAEPECLKAWDAAI